MARSKNTLGTLIWSGEHWVNYLRPRQQYCSGMVSLYHATTVLLARERWRLWISLERPVSREFVPTTGSLPSLSLETMIRGRGNIFGRDLPLVAATMTRSGDIREAPSWTIEAGANHIVVTWANIQPPLVGPPTIHSYISLYSAILC